PAYRGAAPIERALAAGEKETGISIMRMTAGLDEGPWALQRSISLTPWDDAGTVCRALALLGALGIHQVLDALADGTVRWTEQQGPATYAPKLSAGDLWLDVSRDAWTVHNQVRALSPVHGARISSGETVFKVWRSWPYGVAGMDPIPQGAEAIAGRAGVVAVRGERLFVGCAAGVIELLVVQPAGRPRMTAAEFVRGYAGRLGKELRGAT
ncbi:MAG: methionyl-tRNA formyltransferase, partial [Thermoleophilia bacterium]|nr:methionyl-tRNA formyltransferase [Thermoleophilia bacterium]